MSPVPCPFCSVRRSNSDQITAHLLIDHNINRDQNELFQLMEQRKIIQNMEKSLNNHHQQMMLELQQLRNIGSGNGISDAGMKTNEILYYNGSIPNVDQVDYGD